MTHDTGPVPPVGDDIQAYLETLQPVARARASWADGTMPLRLTACLGDAPPDDAYVSSVRCLLLKGSQVLVVRSVDGSHHLLPGGRREPGESLLDTVRRELREETGWTATGLRQLGVVHFHHLRPAPPGYRYPHPDFLWLVYGGQAERQVAEPETGSWEAQVFFRPVAALHDLDLADADRAFLEAARR